MHATPMKFFPLTPQQSTVAEWVPTARRNNRPAKKNGLVIARAGTGKTTLLCSVVLKIADTGANQSSQSTAICAYNSKINREIRAKVEALPRRPYGMNTKRSVNTFHGHGAAVIRACLPKSILLKGGKKHLLVCEEIKVPENLRAFVASAVSMAKLQAFGYLTNADDYATWTEIVERHDLEKALWAKPWEVSAEKRSDMLKIALRWAWKALRKHVDLAEKCHDFDDQLYLPLILNLPMPQYRWVLVDEAQDTNPARRAMAKKMLHPQGRILFVADDKQAIYGFTGADNDAVDVIRREFNCEVFPLTVTFRCPKAVVAEAQKLVADYEAAPSAPQGKYEKIEEGDFYSRFVNTLVPGADAIICRNTAPLIRIAYALIRRGIACHVEGKNIGDDLVRMIKRAKGHDLETIATALYERLETEVPDLMGKGKETQAERLADAIEALLAMIEGMPRGATVADLCARIDSLFADTPEGEKPAAVVLMTSHRSKGLEFPRVFMWGRNLYMPSPYARQDWQVQQEANLEYVTITRAMETLIEVLARDEERKTKPRPAARALSAEEEVLAMEEAAS